MREKRRIYYLVGILSLCLAVTGLCGVTAFAGEKNNYGYYAQDHWTQKYIKKVPPIMMYEPYLSELFGQTDRDVPYNYEEAVKLAGHSCGAISSAWEITKKALEVLYPDETPMRGNIKVYAPGAEDEWHIGVIGEVITYITGAAPHTGFSGAKFGTGDWGYPGDQVYIRKDKMVYTEGWEGTPTDDMTWRFERIDNDTEVCLSFTYSDVEPLKSAYWGLLGVRIASGDVTLTDEEVEDYITWWNDRTEYVFDNADSLVVVTGCD